MTEISAVIIEDEIPVAKSLETLLSFNENIAFKGMAHDIDSGEELIRNVNPNIVFCDIQLGKNATGFDLIERFENPKFKLVFVTAYNEYAIKAFKYNAIDYLLKPIDQEELEVSIERAKKQIQENDAENQLKSLMEMMTQKNDQPKKLLFKTSEQIRAVDLQDIIRLESESNYTSVYLKDGTNIPLAKRKKNQLFDLLEKL